MSEHTIFYSWQSDLPNATNRGFIEQALERAAKGIRTDETIEVEPVIDRDTAGVPGAPDIAQTILAKIDRAAIFVGDVTLINQGTSGRLTPNPNVLIELGYAMRALGTSQVVLVMNTACGSPELLPFDLRMRRIVTYSAQAGPTDRTVERKALEQKLSEALRYILTNLPQPSREVTPSAADVAVQAIEEGRADAPIRVRRFMEELVREIEKIAPLVPDPTDGDALVAALFEALAKSPPIVTTFGRVAEAIAITNAHDAAIALHKAFAGILEHYRVPRDLSGMYRDVDFDLYKILGHELFVTFISFLIRENRWKLLGDVLEEDIYISNPPQGRPGIVNFTYLCRYSALLEHWNEKRTQKWISPHGQILKERHDDDGSLAVTVPFDLFKETDYFLFLRSQLQAQDDRTTHWVPWSAVYLSDQVPRYLAEATRRRFAEQLLRPIGISSIEEFRAGLKTEDVRLSKMFRDGFWLSSDPLELVKPETIGSR